MNYPGQQFYCNLKIKDNQFNPLIINSLVIREWALEILPRIELTLVDDGTLAEVYPLEDNDVIEVSISTNEDDDEKSQLNMKFQLVDYRLNVQGDNRALFVQLTGVLKTNNIFIVKNKSFRNSNSLNVLRTIADEEGITYSNPFNVIPSDNMTWYQIRMSNYDFIKHVLKRTFIADDVVLFYGNSDNEFVYTSLKTETGKQNEIIAQYNLENTENFVLNETDKNKIWFNTYDIVSINGSVNKLSSYQVDYSYYDNKKEVSNSIYYDKSMTSISFQDSSMIKKSVKYEWLGQFNNNLYDKYFESLMRNDYLINKFFSYSLMLNINALSNVKLMDKVDVIFPAFFGQTTSNDVNEVLSGEYLVGGIIHKVSNGGVYNKMISLHRDGMNKSPYIKIWRNA